MMAASFDECDLFALTLESLQTAGHPVHSAACVCLGTSALVFTVSQLSGNYSQVDKLWSIVPFVYAWILCCDSRTLLMAIVSSVWGLRLTYNFYRRGGYKWPPWTGEEDYRWAYIQKGGYLSVLTNRAVWVTFNLVFVSIYQNILLLLIASPSIVAHLVATTPSCSAPDAGRLSVLDALAASLVLIFVAVETLADNQQYAFQTEKYRLRDSNSSLSGEYKDGFYQSGLFAIVRKPNYAAEQAIWVCYYLFSVAAFPRTWINFSATGFVLLLLLFQGSGQLTEQITLEKYPKYKDYMDRVPLYVPNLNGILRKSKKGSKKLE